MDPTKRMRLLALAAAAGGSHRHVEARFDGGDLVVSVRGQERARADAAALQEFLTAEIGTKAEGVAALQISMILTAALKTLPADDIPPVWRRRLQRTGGKRPSPHPRPSGASK